MPKKKRYLVPVSASTKRVHFIRIRFGIIVFLSIAFLGGIAGFFIPFNALTLDVVELNQKRHLREQNRKLLTKIRSMIDMLLTLQKHIETLELAKEDVQNLAGIREDSDETINAEEFTFEDMPLEDITKYVDRTESYYTKLLKTIQENRSYINYMPLLEPVIDKYIINARFGKIKDPFTGKIKMHNGIDFSAERETPVIATASGKVIKIEKHRYWGRRIYIRHKFGFSTVYAHLGTVNVGKNDKVKRGDVIATIGLSGLTTGPHLHYEILRHKVPVDPEKYFFPDIIKFAFANQK